MIFWRGASAGASSWTWRPRTFDVPLRTTCDGVGLVTRDADTHGRSPCAPCRGGGPEAPPARPVQHSSLLFSRLCATMLVAPARHRSEVEPRPWAGGRHPLLGRLFRVARWRTCSRSLSGPDTRRTYARPDGRRLPASSRFPFPHEVRDSVLALRRQATASRCPGLPRATARPHGLPRDGSSRMATATYGASRPHRRRTSRCSRRGGREN